MAPSKSKIESQVVVQNVQSTPRSVAVVQELLAISSASNRYASISIDINMLIILDRKLRIRVSVPDVVGETNHDRI